MAFAHGSIDFKSQKSVPAEDGMYQLLLLQYTQQDKLTKPSMPRQVLHGATPFSVHFGLKAAHILINDDKANNIGAAHEQCTRTSEC